jgi:REP element-mobilizing transposase RayT
MQDKAAIYPHSPQQLLPFPPPHRYPSSMQDPGSKALRRGRKSIPQANYLITKNILESCEKSLVEDANPDFLIHWFASAAKKKWLSLFSFVVMPEHYHIVMKLGLLHPLSKVVGKINENASRLIFHSAGHRFDLWQKGFHDHLIRPSEDIRKYVDYSHMNPVEQGLVEKPEDWLWSSANPKYKGILAELY